MYWKHCQTNKTFCFLSPRSRVHTLRKQMLVQTSQALAPQAASCDSVWISFYFFTGAGLGLWKARLVQSSEHVLASPDLLQAAAQGRLWEYFQWVLQVLSNVLKVRLWNKHYLSAHLAFTSDTKIFLSSTSPLFFQNKIKRGPWFKYCLCSFNKICLYYFPHCSWGAKLHSVLTQYTSNCDEMHFQQESTSSWVKNADFFCSAFVSENENMPIIDLSWNIFLFNKIFEMWMNS